MMKALVFAAVCCLAAAAWGQDRTPVQMFKADRVEVLEPACSTCAIDLNAELPKERYHPQGKLMDDVTLRQWKEFARYNPDVPAGIPVPFSEDAPLRTATPPIRSSFEGINQDVAAGFFPPDTQLAVGPGHILQATNGAIRLASKTNVEVQTANWNTFFAKPGAFLYDPKLFFDPTSRRFIVAILEFKSRPQTSFVRFAVSRSDSPSSLTQGWCRYSYNGKSQGTWSDFPSLGINEKWLAISTNQFRFSDNQYVKAMVKTVDSRFLGDNSAACPKLTAATFNFPISADTSGTIQFAPSYTPTSLSGTPLFAVSTNIGNSNFYDLWRVTGSGATPSMSRTRIFGRSHSLPPEATHKSAGPPYDTDFNRVLSASHRNGIVSFAFGTGCNFGSLPNESCVRLAQILPNDTGGTVSFEADYGGGQNKFFWMPAIAAGAANDIAVIFQQSGTNTFLGAGFSGKRAQATIMEPFKILRAGRCNLIDVGRSDTRNRTGDYAGIAIDPVDGRTFWISAEYSTNLNGKCRWGTRIGEASY